MNKKDLAILNSALGLLEKSQVQKSISEMGMGISRILKNGIIRRVHSRSFFTEDGKSACKITSILAGDGDVTIPTMVKITFGKPSEKDKRKISRTPGLVMAEQLSKKTFA